MTERRRSLDDLPLAAYSTGVVNDGPDDEAMAEARPMTQQEAIAQALAADAPHAAPQQMAAVPDGAPASAGPRLPRPSLPRLAFPKLPRLSSRPRAVAAQQPMAAANPYGATAVHGHVAAASPFTPASAPSPFASSIGSARATAPAGAPGSIGLPRPGGGLGLDGLGGSLRNPRSAVRDPRVLAGAVVVIGVTLLAVNLLGGQAPAGGSLADATSSAPPPIATIAPPGVATVTLTGEIEGTYSLTGAKGPGRPADGALDSAWVDTLGSTLSLVGRVTSGTRTTDGALVLTWIVVIDGEPLTFSSSAGECTIGMAELAGSVRGSFVCTELASNDGEHVVKVTGNYQT